MPGLKIVVGSPTPGRPLPEADRFAPDVPLDRIEVFSGPRTEVRFAAAPHHPRLAHVGPDFEFFLEGVVYDRSDDELKAFASELARAARNDGAMVDRVRDFMHDTDGDYVFVLVLEGGNRVIAFNDPWGRLPLYAAHWSDGFLLGREPTDLLPHLPDVRVDRQAIAEWLAFEYTLRPEWFVRGILQVQGGVLFDVRVGERGVVVEQFGLQRHDFTVSDPVGDRREAARRYAEHYLRSYASRVTRLSGLGHRLTVDLSGGFDTRAVFAGARRLNAPMEYYTDELVTGDESAAAMRLAETGGVPVTRVAQGPPITDEAEWRRLVYLSGGRVTYDTMLGSLLVTRSRSAVVTGPASRFMGFGGELVRRPYVRPHGYRCFADALADDVYTRFIRIGEAARLAGLAPDGVHRRLATAVESWNERNDADRARRLYYVFHRGLVAMGEDRHRWYFWTVTPMWARPVLDFAYGRMRAEAVGYRFFVEMLRAVYPRVLEAPLHRNPTRLTSAREVATYQWKESLRGHLQNTRGYLWYRRLLPQNEFWAPPATPERFAWYRRQFEDAFRESGTVRATLDEAAVRAWVHPAQAQHRMNHLLTTVYFLAGLGERFPGTAAAD